MSKYMSLVFEERVELEMEGWDNKDAPVELTSQCTHLG